MVCANIGAVVCVVVGVIVTGRSIICGVGIGAGVTTGAELVLPAIKLSAPIAIIIAKTTVTQK
jgi:hypothetical protein